MSSKEKNWISKEEKKLELSKVKNKSLPKRKSKDSVVIKIKKTIHKDDQ